MLPAKTKSATRFIMPAAVLLLAVSAAAILLRNRRAAVTSPIASAPAPAQPAGSASPVAVYTPPQVPLAVPASPVEAPPPPTPGRRSSVPPAGQKPAGGFEPEPQPGS